MKSYKSRQYILNRIKKLNGIITTLHAETIELNKQQLVMSDNKQQYSEGFEEFGRGKNKVTHFIGRIHWKEYFTDEDTGERVWIHRSRVVKQDGEFI
jgi:hypothetical protein